MRQTIRRITPSNTPTRNNSFINKNHIILLHATLHQTIHIRIENDEIYPVYLEYLVRNGVVLVGVPQNMQKWEAYHELTVAVDNMTHHVHFGF